MTYARQNVAGPSVQVNPYALMDAIDWRTLSDPHVLQGVTWQSVCPATSQTTLDPCYRGDLVLPKSKTTAYNARGATPFTVYTEIDCSPPGFWDNADANVAAAHELGARAAIERVLQTGSVAGTGQAQFPHLAANTQVIDQGVVPVAQNIVLQMAAQVVTGVPLDMSEAIARLEQILNPCINGLGVVHLTRAAFELLAANFLLKWTNNLPYTMGGNRIVVGDGYTNVAPDGSTPTAGNTWIYGTGPMFGYRSGIKTFPNISELDRTVNTMHVITEETFVIAYDCCLAAVEVTLGGKISGSFNSPT